MPELTGADRLRRRFILMTGDSAMESALQAQMLPGWDMVRVTDLGEIGDWHDGLFYRFLLLDLDETDIFDPLDVVCILRMRHAVNIPVFCFGGDENLKDEMRLARADCFFGRDEILNLLPRFMEQYRWGSDE